MSQDYTTEGTLEERPKRQHVRIAGRRMPIPRSRKARIVSGVILVTLGCFGFLPVLGFWMIPVGLLILSVDMPTIRRKRRLLEVWWYRRKNRKSNLPARDGDQRP